MGMRLGSSPQPGIKSINGVESSGSNLQLISSNNSIIIEPSSEGRSVDLRIVEDSLSSAVIENLAMPIAQAEYNLTLPLETKQFTLKLRNSGILWYSYTSGGAFFTVPLGCSKTVSGLNGGFIDIYVKSSTSSNVLEIEYWV